MAVISMREMLEAGVHFGHQTRRWNPKMKRFIFGERNGIYIIDLEQTATRINTAYGFVRDLVADGGDILFVGTKKQAQDPIQSYALKVGMPFVNHRWLGGMLTNFETISKSVNKMLELERMKASGEFDVMIKKEALLLDRELIKLQRVLGGLRDMKSVPAAVFVVDTKKEHIAVTEANKLGIPVVAVVDTNVDPELIQYPIPGNDDAIRANTLLVKAMADAVEEGRYVASRRPKQGGDVEVEQAPQRTPEEEAAFAQAQAEARNAAAAAQAERERRLAASKAPAPADPTFMAATDSTEQQADTDVSTADKTLDAQGVVDVPDVTTDAEAAAAEAAGEAELNTPAPKSAPEAANHEPFGAGSHDALPDGSEPDGYPIKGNADSMLYHVPGSSHYNRTKAEVWFATEQAAEAAGFQKPASQRD